MTRRELARILAGIAAAGTTRGDEPILSVSGVDHIKLRVANAGASAMFYYGLFGGDVVPVRNSTFRNSLRVDEVFLKIGAPPFPYLMLSGIREGESPGLDHLSVLAGNPVAARATLTRKGISLIDPGQGLWFRDTDGMLIELMAGPTWGLQAQSIRLPVPSNLASLRPAFETAALTRIHLRIVDIGRATSFYSQLFGRDKATGERRFTCGPTVLQLDRGAGLEAPGLDRLVISIRGFRPKQARRILEQRGIQPGGSQRQVLLRDPDGNELELVAV
jgi:hypothetical protein